MKIKIKSIAVLLALPLCFSYLAGCAGNGDAWVKKSESMEYSTSPESMVSPASSMSDQQETMNSPSMTAEQEKIPARPMMEGGAPE
jgi:hypothetical protein